MCGDSMVVKPIGILSDIVQTCETTNRCKHLWSSGWDRTWIENLNQAMITDNGYVSLPEGILGPFSSCHLYTNSQHIGSWKASQLAFLGGPHADAPSWISCRCILDNLRIFQHLPSAKTAKTAKTGPKTGQLRFGFATWLIAINF